MAVSLPLMFLPYQALKHLNNKQKHTNVRRWRLYRRDYGTHTLRGEAPTPDVLFYTTQHDASSVSIQVGGGQMGGSPFGTTVAATHRMCTFSVASMVTRQTQTLTDATVRSSSTSSRTAGRLSLSLSLTHNLSLILPPFTRTCTFQRVVT